MIAVVLFKHYHRKPLGLNRFVKLCLNIVYFQDNFRRKFNAFTMFLCWIVIFNFLVRSLLQNSIKTNQVVVDTFELISDVDKLLNTKKEMVSLVNLV